MTKTALTQVIDRLDEVLPKFKQVAEENRKYLKSEEKSFMDGKAEAAKEFKDFLISLLPTEKQHLQDHHAKGWCIGRGITEEMRENIFNENFQQYTPQP